MTKPFDLEDRLILFAFAVVKVIAKLPEAPECTYIKDQLRRSCLSPIGNYGEAQGAESVDDVIHKLGVVLKELKETRAWLKALRMGGYVSAESVGPVAFETEELIRIIVKMRTKRIGSTNRRQ